MVASTSTGPSTLGSTWRSMMRAGADADHARRLHVFLVALDQRRAAHGARVLHPAGQPMAMISTQKASVSCAFGASRGDAVDQQRDQDRRERQHHVATRMMKASTQPPT
jgi:hypothetical protein